ncbi:MAG: NIL domain-containing protein [Elainella sp. Prado103]|jgi:ABC-type methionine transport system ATPase subunit|nr:NIL domain-containing protein [Elainella sp. Prado103]
MISSHADDQFSHHSIHDRHTQMQIRLRISKQYHQEPIISELIARYGVTVNILGALLSQNAREDGWFDLELRGNTAQVNSALNYLNDLNLQIWRDSDANDTGW